jgi:hypothetical protein
MSWDRIRHRLALSWCRRFHKRSHILAYVTPTFVAVRCERCELTWPEIRPPYEEGA